MKLQSPGIPELFPDPDKTSILRLGLRRLPARQWFVDEDLEVFARHKQQMLTSGTHPACMTVPGSEAAQREFSEILLNHLLNSPAGNYQARKQVLLHKSGLSWPLPAGKLEAASQWIAEDICLLEPRKAGYTLTAASVCSPSNWRLEDKIGKSLTDIHQAVPGYQQSLNQRVNRLFDRLAPERLFLRYNWSIQPGNELNWQAATVSEADFSRPFWRVERQTLLRLPRSGAIVFAIRLFLYDISQLRNSGGFIPALDAQLENLRQVEKDYKGLASNWWRQATMNS